jgi:hypothetical protein
MSEAKALILRYQDVTGRGPWRPGFSHRWVDMKGPPQLPPIQDEIDLPALLRALQRRQLHVGCGVRGWEGVKRWFSYTERLKLGLLGFRLVDASGCEVLAETPHQVVVGSRRPLAELPVFWAGLAYASPAGEGEGSA